jgi:hypothetical protein
MSHSFLCESDTTEDSVQIMEQAWEALLCNTLRQVSDEDTNQDSIISAINHCYSEIASGYITSAQTEFDKLFVKVVCTAILVCTTAPNKNIPHFELHKSYKNSRGRNLQAFTREMYDGMQATVQCQIEKMSKVMIADIKQYRKD